MSLDADVSRLGRVRPFSALPREALQMLAFSCPKRRIAVDELLFRAGEPAEGAFLVLEGDIRMVARGIERRAIPGVLIGESALLVETVRPTDARARRDSLLLEIPRETFRRVLPEFPEAAAEIYRAAAARSARMISELEAIRRRGFTPV